MSYAPPRLDETEAMMEAIVVLNFLGDKHPSHAVSILGVAITMLLANAPACSKESRMKAAEMFSTSLRQVNEFLVKEIGA